MHYRQLGKSGLEVSALGLGCMAMTNLYGSVDKSEAVATIRAALDFGANFLGTADTYADGKNGNHCAARRPCYGGESALRLRLHYLPHGR